MNNTTPSSSVPPQPQQPQQQPQLTIESATAEFRAGVTAVLRSWSPLKTAVESQWGGLMGKEKAEFLRTHIYAQFDYSKANIKNDSKAGAAMDQYDLEDALAIYMEEEYSIVLNKDNKAGAAMDQYDLEDALAIYMEEEYSIVLEDDSERQVALCIVQMYELCGRGDFSLSRGTIQKANEAMTKGTASGNGNGGKKTVVQTDGELDEESDDEDMNHAAALTSAAPAAAVAAVSTATSADEYAKEWLFGPPPREHGMAPKEGPPPRQLGEVAMAQTPEGQQAQTELVDDDGFMTVSTKKKR
eukprot:CAMPEP_0194125392 /NCGR_PEP_ID=MMETSP0150-20130528/59440_1 /TAXON_ID=122233 /ORGANISM="Chaetoceros debilis, Strain MM31A-1" /LENGTH=299 /DNA_ID=CAMNT_0038819199 /DNA_START=70 /DNA_END=969 /DNA_ORIENTATION=+